MDAAQHLVQLGPIAIVLVDATMLGLAGAIAMFRPVLQAVVRSEPAALLLVEFAEDEAENRRRLQWLGALLGDLDLDLDRTGAHWGSVAEVLDPALQTSITELHTSGLNIMMSMKDEAKPVSFVEECAVALEHLADYTDRLTQIFERHGTRGTWYAHASEGCLHVRPVLNLRLEKDVRAMRAIAEKAFQAVRDYKGSHLGEHGDQPSLPHARSLSGSSGAEQSPRRSRGSASWPCPALGSPPRYWRDRARQTGPCGTNFSRLIDLLVSSTATIR